MRLFRLFLLLMGLHLALTGGAMMVARRQPPESPWIAYTANFNGDGNIYVMRADGSQPRRLTGDAGDDYSPFWSSDGQWISFTARRYGVEERFRIRPNGAGLERLPLRNGDAKLRANLSPDGNWVVLISSQGGNWDIYRVRRDGSQRQRLTTNPGQDGFPGWSASGQWVVFAAEHGSKWDIYKMRADGGDQQRLTRDSAKNWQPVWSPVIEKRFRGESSVTPGVGLAAISLWWSYRVWRGRG